MDIEVKYFGQIAEEIGKNSEQLSLSIEESEDLSRYFVSRYPSLEKLNYRIAVNETFANQLDKNQELATVALLPPFAGG
jgi:molybdopterin converting factor small subunit